MSRKNGTPSITAGFERLRKLDTEKIGDRGLWLGRRS